MNQGVHVKGIPELARALKAVDRDAYQRLRLSMKAIAQHVIEVAIGKGAPAAALRPRATQKGAGIAYPRGGPDSASETLGFYPWLDYGGGRRAGRGVTPSGDRRGVKPGGRYVYPAIGESREYIADAAYDAITKAARAQGFEVRGG